MILEKRQSQGPLGCHFSKIIAGSGSRWRDARTAPPPTVGSGAVDAGTWRAQRSTVPLMKSSTACFASLSVYCTGGLFMK